MKNWKTTAAGILGGALVAIGGSLQAGHTDWRSLLIGAAIAALGSLAKDHDVSGGQRTF